MEVSEQSRIFDEWLSRHKGLLFKVVHAYGFTSQHAETGNPRHRVDVYLPKEGKSGGCR